MHMEREWDEYEEKEVKHDVHEKTTYELAEQELKAQEQNARYYWNEQHEL